MPSYLLTATPWHLVHLQMDTSKCSSCSPLVVSLFSLRRTKTTRSFLLSLRAETRSIILGCPVQTKFGPCLRSVVLPTAWRSARLHFPPPTAYSSITRSLAARAFF